MFQPSLRVFVCAFRPETSSFFRKEFPHSFPILLYYMQLVIYNIYVSVKSVELTV